MGQRLTKKPSGETWGEPFDETAGDSSDESLNGSLEDSLDDSSFEGLYERAIGRLKEQAPWWTHQEVSDPGITLIEMWAMLADMQSYYMDQVGEAHYRKYLKLLGVEEDAGELAAAWIFFSGVEQACVIPQGTKLLSGEMVFETEEEVELTDNSIVGFYQGEGRNRVMVMNLYRKSRFVLQEDRERVLFSFALKKTIPKGGRLTLYLLLDERAGRSPAGEGFYMAQPAWEYCTKDGWKEAKILRDDTRGLLYSGILCLEFKTAWTGQEDGYRMRCRVKEGTYDMMPVLYKIYLNVVRARQKDTLCCTENVSIPAGGGRVALRHYLAKTGNLRVFLEETEDIYREITADCAIDPPVTAMQKERFLSCPGEGNVTVVCTSKKQMEESVACPVTGVSSQHIPLPWENVMENRVEWMLCGADGLYRRYCRTEPEEERYVRAWHWQEGKKVIVLGDGRHGDIPEPSEEGLCFTSLVLWEAEKGNVSIGRITQWERPDLFAGISCTNHLIGNGGRSAKKPSEQFAGIAKVLQKANRMVTEEDIRGLAKETPGLLLRDVAAHWEAGRVVVTIFPAVPLKNEGCVQRYETEVAKYLEPFRMVGSRLEVKVAPV